MFEKLLRKILGKLLHKKTEIQYIVKDPMLQKQNKLIYNFIRISLDNTNIRKAAQEMITVIKEQYDMKNCSIFINKENELKYLASDIEVNDYRESVKEYINLIQTENDAVFIDSNEGKCLSYTFAEERNIVYGIFVYLKKIDDVIGAIYIELDTKKNIDIFEQEIFKTVMETMTLAVENLIIRKKLILLSTKDQLTQLYNRTYLEEYLKDLNASDNKYTLAMIDIDFFKKINDNYGHEVGDDVLKYVSVVLSKLSEYNCTVFRIGGEEFLVIAPDDSIKSKTDLASLIENVRKEIEHKEILYLCNTIKITISAGIADCSSGKNFDEVKSKADQELYKVKNSGRNRVSIYGVGNN